MTDNEIRGSLLRRYYELRDRGKVALTSNDFEGRLSDGDIARVNWQLHEHGLINALLSPINKSPGPRRVIEAEISAKGVDVVEGTSQPPISISYTERVFNISHSTGIQIGDHNTQQILQALESIVQQIEKSDASEEEKLEAKSRLARLLKHPILVELFGEAISRLPQFATLAHLAAS